ncbi:MAG: sialidase family protein [Planctomycetota bacterium]
MKKKAEPGKPGKPASLANIVELMDRPDEKERDWSVLLKGGAPEGDAVLSKFWGQVSYFERDDGTLGAIDSHHFRALSRDGGRTYEYLPKLELPKPPAGKLHSMGGASGYNGPAGTVKMKSGRLGMTWTQVYPVGGNQEVVNFFFRTSHDDGETWSDDVLVNPGHDKGTPLYDTLRQLKSGRLIQPVRWCHWAGDIHRKTAVGWVDGERLDIEGHGHHPEFEVAYCYYSDDEGKTWARSRAEILGYLHDGWDNFVTCDEPALDQLRDGRLLMLIRTPMGRLFQATSEDEGTTWSIPKPTMLATDFAPCALRRIPKTGDLLCVWNQASANEIQRGLRRNRLSAAVTSDGETWKHFHTLEWHPCLPEAGCIAPEERVILVRALDDVGEIPKGWGFSTYPTVAVHGDEVIVAYSHGAGRRPKEVISKPKHRILPLSWFYER